jgi:rare lipoprotein A
LAELSKNNLKVCKIEESKLKTIEPIKKSKSIKRTKKYPIKLRKVEKLNIKKHINYDEVGIASYYANCLNGCPTACGVPYRKNLFTGAHRTLPFGTIVSVTMLSTGKKVNVKINDRGPYAKGRVIDLSFKAAQKIGLVRRGVSKVSIKVLN